MSDRLKLYIAEHLDEAVDLYLLASQVVEWRAESSLCDSDSIDGAEEAALFRRFKKARDRIAAGAERGGMYVG